MKNSNTWLWVAAACLAGAAPAGAAVVKSSFGVGATVLGPGCRIVPGRAQGCAPAAPRAGASAAPSPLVSFTRDAKTGVITQTITF